MSEENGPVVVLGVTGSIAAFKAAELASRLAQSGARVFTLMTQSACRFVSPLTFQALTGNPVGTDLFSEGKGSKVEHIEIARRADLILIAPATANVIGKLANGLADDLLTAAVLASTAPVLVAPAMNPAMWSNPAVRANIERIRALGFEVVEPGVGRLACGETGPGRLADLDEIMARVAGLRTAVETLAGHRLLVTAGPTREPLDSVRYVSNPSTGKMGYAVAREAVRLKADVLLVSGPVALPDPFGARTIRVTTGSEMRQAVLGNAEWAEAIVMSAAVTDYRSAKPREGKNKESGWDLKLEKVGNILEELAERKNGRVMVGFAAEVGDPEPEAARKLAARDLDLIVANDVSREGSGFGTDTNEATIIFRDGRREKKPLMSKSALARVILAEVALLLKNRPASNV
jgi:phosphopantothenoylcysteine decarboxylase/phosphopantothenate--cysteine ligase